jgi:2-polyprenyl-6-methoxyphenol hydroxylase-like FAD-dependent oxidoreductase
MKEDESEVIIVGGGPVGLGLAIELGQRGIGTILVERHPSPPPIPKGQNLTQRTMEHMHAWGCEAALRAARTIPPEYGIGGLTAYRSLFGPWHYDWLQRDLVRSFYTRDNERLPQYATEQVLRDRAARIPAIDLRLGWTARAVADGDAGVEVRIENGGESLTLRGRYAVGCDGSRSLVREAAGITQTLTDHDRLMVLLVFRSARLHALLGARHPGKSFFNVLDPALEGYWKFFGRVDMDGQFFFHAPVPRSARDGGMDFAALLQEAAGETFDIEMDHVGFWDLRFAIADRYRVGRIFVAGDAAHSHPPYGGYGINTGFEDARNLGWKLAAMLRGWGGETLLDSYDAERRPVFASTARDFIARSIEQDRAFLAAFDPARDRAAFEAVWAERATGAKTEVGSFEPNYPGSPVVPGGEGGSPSAVGRHGRHAVAGKHLTPALLPSGQQVDEALGPGLTLFAGPDHAREADAFAAAAAALGIPLSIVAAGAAAGEDGWAAGLVLTRPDQFVAWASDALPGDPELLLARVAGRDLAPAPALEQA